MIHLPWTRQPVGPVQPDWGNSLLAQASGLWRFENGARNLITGEPTVLSGTAYYGVGPSGQIARTVSGTNRVQLASDSRNLVPTSGGFTVFLHYRKLGAAAATAGFGVDATANANQRAGTHFPFSDGTLYWDFGGNTAGTNRLTAASLTFGDDYWVFTTGPAGMEIWQNGIRRAQQGSSANWGGGTSNPYLLGMHGTATNADDAECAMFGCVQRQWTPAECLEWSARPWQVFAEQILYVRKPATGSYTLTADVGTFALNGQDATLLKSKSLTADVGTYTLTGQDATLTKGRILTADVGTFTLSGQDATLLKSKILVAAVGTFSLTGQDATFNYTGGSTYTLSAAAGTYTLTGQDATLTKTKLLTAAFGSYSLAGQAATLIYSGTPPVVTDPADFTLSFPGGASQRIGGSSGSDETSRIGPSTASGSTQRILH